MKDELAFIGSHADEMCQAERLYREGKLSLNGDTYYKTAYPLHNLVRTRNQLQLFRRIKERFFPE